MGLVKSSLTFSLYAQVITTFLEKIVSKLSVLYLPKSETTTMLSELFNFISAFTLVR